jgi:hypothetical protein
MKLRPICGHRPKINTTKESARLVRQHQPGVEPRCKGAGVPCTMLRNSPSVRSHPPTHSSSNSSELTWRPLPGRLVRLLSGSSGPHNRPWWTKDVRRCRLDSDESTGGCERRVVQHQGKDAGDPVTREAVAVGLWRARLAQTRNRCMYEAERSLAAAERLGSARRACQQEDARIYCRRASMCYWLWPPLTR